GRSRWNLPRRLSLVKLGPPADKTPAIGVKVPELFLDLEEGACVAHCGLDLHPVANDLQIRCKFLDTSLGVTRDFLRIEFVERAAITFPLFQHERPAQSCLCAGEHENLEMFAVVVNGDPPFAIVILEQNRIIQADPGAPLICEGCTTHKMGRRMVTTSRGACRAARATVSRSRGPVGVRASKELGCAAVFQATLARS